MVYRTLPSLAQTTLVALLLPSIAYTQVYTWKDEHGNTHFGDSPPQNTTVEEIKIQNGPSTVEIEAAERALAETIELRKRRIQSQTTIAERAEKNSPLENNEKQAQCAQARQQFSVLSHAQRIFKAGPDWSRSYQEDDKERAMEAKHLGNWILENCEGDAESVDYQFELANEINANLSITCFNAREWLARRSGKKLSDGEESRAKRNKEYLQAECPAIDYNGLWLADWLR